MRTAIFSTFPPRVCGIGAFASDVQVALLGADGMSVDSVVVVDAPSSPQRPDVLVAVSQAVRGDYVRAARLLSRLDVDVVLLQHEYGIFGGDDGEYVLSFARELNRPLVVNLHTVLSKPSPGQHAVLRALCAEAERVTVMTETAVRLVVELGICAVEKVRVVPHGAPAVLGRRRDELAAGRRPHYVAANPGGYTRMDDRFLLATFGLLSSGKGVEMVIDALPSIVERHPEVLYLVAGRTHPQVSRREGERYRLMLERRVVDLGLVEHVEFDNRFLSIDELADLLAVTDVFVTPYRNRDQIASGALTFAIAAGCAAVSTPYLYAVDVLASGAGQIVPFDDPQAIADAVCEFASNPAALHTASAEAARVGSGLLWPAVAESLTAVLLEASALPPSRVPSTPPLLPPPTVRTDHLHTLVDSVGIVQHAHGIIPNRSTGYCVDDVARLVGVALELERRDGDPRWSTMLYRAMAFLYDATDESGKGMRNFMSYERRWLDEPHVGDHVGRSIWALGEVLSTAWVPGVVEPARRLLGFMVASLGGGVTLRTAAYSVLGLARLDPDRLEPPARRLLERLLEQLIDAYRSTAAEGWSWLEDDLRYDNARLPQALVIGGRRVGRDDAVEIGLEALRWLGDECGLASGRLRLPGHQGRHRSEPAPGAGDEQPLEACAFVEAELAALAVTCEPVHRVRAQTAFDWFLGRNRLDRPLYDFATGGCSDGLGLDDLNDNEGAESTLAFHRAQLAIDAAGVPAIVGHRIAPPTESAGVTI